MSLVSNLETRVGGWLKSVPHLPAGAQKWLGSNVWWIVLVGVILSGISLLIGIIGFFAALALIGTATSYYGYAVTSDVYGGGWIAGSLVSLAFTVVAAILLATAIAPLKAKSKAGWNRLFIVLLLDAVFVVLNSILSFNPIGFIFGLIFGAIGLAIGAYFTFEIRGQFIEHKATKAAAKN